MRENRPSATAQRVAMRRAAHQLLDDPKVFGDPLALRIIGKESALALQADPHQFEATPLSSYLRAFVAARSRYAEDERQRRTPSRELVTRDERSGLRCPPSYRTLQASFSLSSVMFDS